MAETPLVDVKKLSFERAIEELETIVKRLEDGKVPLEEWVAIYERGEALKRRCEELLRQAEARVEKITTDASGAAAGVAPLDVQKSYSFKLLYVLILRSRVSGVSKDEARAAASWFETPALRAPHHQGSNTTDLDQRLSPLT